MSRKPRHILSPEQICLYRAEYSASTMDFLTEIDGFNIIPEPVVIDFSGCKYISAAAAVMTFAKITRCQILADTHHDGVTHQSIQIILPADKVAKKLFTVSGMFNAIKPGGLKKLDKLWSDMENPFKTSNDPNGEMSNVIRHLKKTLGKVPSRLVAALGEAVLNIRHHAYQEFTQQDIDGRWWQYILHNPQRKTVSVVIYDMGIGIAESIKRKYYSEGGSRIAQDNALIEYAMTQGKTRHDNDEGRGNGFTNIKQPMDMNASAKYLLVCSGRGIVKYKDQAIISSDCIVNNVFGGTLIEWNFEESQV